MASTVLDGKVLAKHIEETLSERVQRLKELSRGVTPTLATILVGNDPASATYVRMKRNACKRVGMGSLLIALAQETTTEELLAHIERLNRDLEVHGILLQHPVPSHIDERRCFDAIGVDKDVDGVTCHGFGRMAMGANAYGSVGKHAVVVGRSPILGKPLAMMLLNAHATVTICHSRTQNLPALVQAAEIVVGAVGRPEFIKGAWIAAGAVVIDAGYHPGGVGDVELSAVIDKCAAYTPVPGGVGPMTIATLLTQTLEAAEKVCKA
jgi:methylenetetrahydrofolate dehydrogenase (NADP+) / methenyltetrahydrofolate cyclohydrolase